MCIKFWTLRCLPMLKPHWFEVPSAPDTYINSSILPKWNSDQNCFRSTKCWLILHNVYGVLSFVTAPDCATAYTIYDMHTVISMKYKALAVKLTKVLTWNQISLKLLEHSKLSYRITLLMLHRINCLCDTELVLECFIKS